MLILQTDGDLDIPISLDLNSSGDIEHATGLIARKKSGTWEFIFLDPLNWKMSSTDTYKKTLGAIVRFFKDEAYARKNAIRFNFGSIFTDSRDPNSVRNMNNRGRLFWNELKKRGWLHDEFFLRLYKKPFCKIGTELATLKVPGNVLWTGFRDYCDEDAQPQ